MKLFTKEELIEEMEKIFSYGWHKSIKRTVDTRNDGAVGNTLEHLLGISENNLPIPNAREWELKGQRLHTSSLITLKHSEPSPRGASIVSNVLLPNYGWPHQKAGKGYPNTERSFRSTTSANCYTNRGFTISVDRVEKKLKFTFDSEKVDRQDPAILLWLKEVEQRVGLGPINPVPYWAFDDLAPLLATKLKNCFYVVAASRIEDGHEWFKYEKLYVISGFSFEEFLLTVENGYVMIDFDARTHHNHGTKFRLKQGCWPNLYSSVIKVI